MIKSSVTCDKSVVYCTNKTERHDITEMLLKGTLNTYIIVTDMEGNIRMYILPMGRGTDQWK